MLFVEGQGLLQPPPHLQDHRLVPVAALQPVLVAQLLTESFLLFVEGHGFLQPPPHLQDHRLVPVAGLQPVLVAQLLTDGFLLFVEDHGFLQPPPRPQNQRLVPVAALQPVFSFGIVTGEPTIFFAFLNCESGGQLAGSLRGGITAIHQHSSAVGFAFCEKPLTGGNNLRQALPAVFPAALPILKHLLQGLCMLLP